MTYGEARKAFADAFGGLLKVKASETDAMAALGLTADVTIKDSDTAAEVNGAFKSHGLKATVRTIDDWVAVIDDMPMSMVSRIGKNSTKVKMQAMLDNNSTSASAPAPKPSPASKPGAEDKINTPKFQPTQSAKETEEDMGEILNKLEVLDKEIKKLQARVAQLEKKTAATLPGKESKPSTVASEKEFAKDKMVKYLYSYVRDKDGSRTKFYKSAKMVNFDYSSRVIKVDIILTNKGRLLDNATTNESYIPWTQYQSKVLMVLTTIAEELGHTFSTPLPDNLGDDSSANTQILKNAATELVNKYGRFGIFYYGQYRLDPANSKIEEFNPNGIQELVSKLSDASIIEREWANKPFKDDRSWTDTERFNAIKDYVNSLTPKYPGK